MNSTIVAPPTARQKLARNVIIFRARRGLSQKALADATGFSRTTISNIERAETDTSIDAAEKLSHVLSASFLDLFADDTTSASADDEELTRLAAASRENSVDARALLVAIDEAAGYSQERYSDERYSNAGRPRTVAS
jgi:transcriptional regulator with XRE-family HTH domain